MKCIFCDELMLELGEVWCPNHKCRTHYTFEQHTDNTVYLKEYKFQNYPDPKKPHLSCQAIFTPESPVGLAHFQIILYEEGVWKSLLDLDYLPNYITPFNFTDKLKTYLVFS